MRHPLRAGRRLLPLLTILFFCHLAQASSARVLVYGDSNSWGWIPTPRGVPTTRLADAQRWPGVLARALGDGTEVKVDALSGRTAGTDYPAPLVGLPGTIFNGRRSLAVALGESTPLDLVILMLGTNDVRNDLARSASGIAQDIAALAAEVRHKGSGVATTYPPPRVLVVVPPPLGDVSHTPIGGAFEGMAPKSLALGVALRRALAGHDVTLFDASQATGTARGLDGIHMTPEQHAALGRALAPVVRGLLRHDLPSTQETHP